MTKAGVVCEFNPFHNGHKFLLENIKAHHADEVVCVMSGSFVQRGDIAITDKFTRARAALSCGADMVAELPTAYALSSAQRFAANGVRMAAELGCDKLCFGAENSIKELYRAIDAIDDPAVQDEIAVLMKAGSYYPRALSEAVGGELGEIISRPNNILAIEYIRACRVSGIEPTAIPRGGVDHDSDLVSSDIASATEIRRRMLSGEPYEAFTPMRIDKPVSVGAIEAAVMYRLKTMRVQEIAGLPDVSEGLENRISRAAREYNSLSELLEKLKTKRYTMARLRRIVLCALLGITREIQDRPVPYLRILGVREDKKRMISSRSLPMIVDVRAGYDRLDISAKEIFDLDLRATEAMNLAGDKNINEFSIGLVNV